MRLPIASRQAEAELGQLKPAIKNIAFARWAQAARHPNAAMQSELQGDYETCVKEYKAAAHAYAVAADRFPNDEDAYYTNAARMRFYADASAERAKAAVARANDIEVQLHKGRNARPDFLRPIDHAGGRDRRRPQIPFPIRLRFRFTQSWSSPLWDRCWRRP